MRHSSGWRALWMVGILPLTLFAETVDVNVKSSGANTSMISLDTQVKSTEKTLWDLMTDFNHQAQFLPYMTLSEVIGKEGNNLLVNQAGTIHILFWSFTMRMKQRVTEDPPGHIHFQTIEGDFKKLEGDFHLSPGPTASWTHLACQFEVEPKRYVPDWAVRMAARRYLRKMVHALAQRAEEM